MKSPSFKLRQFSRAGSMALHCTDCSLAELCLPHTLSTEETDRFSSIVRQCSPMGSGEILYRSGDALSAIYAVKCGSIKTLIASSDGEEQITGFFMPGELLGFDGLDDGHSCTAVTLERTILCKLPTTSVDQLAGQIPGLRRELFRMMSRKLNQEQSMLFLLGQRSADERVAAFLLSLSTRMRRRGLSGKAIQLSMSRHDIANYLGMAPETVSRHLGRLTDKGVISVIGRTVTVEDPAALRSSVEPCISPDLLPVAPLLEATE